MVWAWKAALGARCPTTTGRRAARTVMAVKTAAAPAAGKAATMGAPGARTGAPAATMGAVATMAAEPQTIAAELTTMNFEPAATAKGRC